MNLNLTLKIWRQKNQNTPGKMVTYQMDSVSTEMSFLEMLDVLNEDIATGKAKSSDDGDFKFDPVAFDSDCREGICGMCSLYINGRAHGPVKGHTVCELHMRHFKDGETIVIEPWRAKAFPVLKDLVVDRTAFDLIIQAGGFVSVNTGGTPDANAIPIPKENAELAMDAAACIGCGACVASCKNASAMLFVSAKVSQLNLLPQGQPEKDIRIQKMVDTMDGAGFGACTNEGECEADCPKEINLTNIARLHRGFIRSSVN